MTALGIGQRVRRVLTRSFALPVSLCSVALCLALVRVGVLWAEEAAGDMELLRVVAATHADNYQRIRTWLGSAQWDSQGHDVIDPDPGRRSEFRNTSTISFAIDDSRQAIRSNWRDTEIRYRPTEDGHVIDNPALNIANRLVRPDGLYRYRGSLERDVQLQLVIWPHEASQLKEQEALEDLDPRTYLTRLSASQDIEEMLQARYDTFKDATNRSLPDGVHFSVHRDGELLVINEATVPASGRMEQEYGFDLARGGNLVFFEQDTPIYSLSKTLSYESHDGIWLPALIHEIRTDKRKLRTRILTIQFNTASLNQPIADSEFSVESLGVSPGDPVVDRRAPGEPIVYRFGADDDHELDKVEDDVAELVAAAPRDALADKAESPSAESDPRPAPPDRRDTGASPKASVSGSWLGRYRYAALGVCVLVVAGVVVIGMRRFVIGRG